MKKMIIYVLIVIFLVSGILIYNKKNIEEVIDYETRNLEEIINSVSENNIDNLITKIYTNKELESIGLGELNLEELDKKFRVECIRTDDSEYVFTTYRVVYKSRNRYLIMFFDENGNILDCYITKMSKNKSKFDYVKIGKTNMTEVYFKDRGKGMYSLFEASMTKEVNYSWHYTNDGYLITIEYDKDNVVQNISVNLL